jgi:uncharacterized protein (DUF952 family)
MGLIFHITTASDWAQAQAAGEYTTSTRGKTLAEQGFIHGSTAEQVAPVANMIYKGLTDLLVLVIDTDRVQPEVRFERVPGWDDPFPHIYGPLNADAVVETWPLDPGPGGRFFFAAGGAVKSEITQEEALRQADALVGQALRETEARCAVLGQYINDCESRGSKTAAWSEALRELSSLHGYRKGLMRRRSLIQQALDCPVAECPAKAPLTAPPNRAVGRTQQQVQIRARRRGL